MAAPAEELFATELFAAARVFAASRALTASIGFALPPVRKSNDGPLATGAAVFVLAAPLLCKSNDGPLAAGGNSVSLGTAGVASAGAAVGA